MKEEAMDLCFNMVSALGYESLDQFTWSSSTFGSSTFTDLPIYENSAAGSLYHFSLRVPQAYSRAGRTGK
jgi:hypothetical protein